MISRRSTPTVAGQPVFFDPLAVAFERFADAHDHYYRPWIDAAVPDLHQAPGSRAVDLGCGSGRFTTLLADRHADVLAVDISERELDLARAHRHRPNIDYQHRSLLAVTPEDDGLFDLVFSVNTLHHLRDHGRVLPHLRSLVRPGGTLAVIDIVSTSDHYTSPWWHRWQGLVDAARTLTHHRSPRHALHVARLRLHPVWIDHVTTNTPLTRDQFHAQYAAAYPGAVFTDDLAPILAALTWTAPADHPTT